MEHAIELLKERLEKLNYAYEKFVLSGKVRKNSSSAMDNRKKADEIERALEILINYK